MNCKPSFAIAEGICRFGRQIGLFTINIVGHISKIGWQNDTKVCCDSIRIDPGSDTCPLNIVILADYNDQSQNCLLVSNEPSISQKTM